MGILDTLFGSSNAFKSIENIATEWIETDKESAEAKVLLVKTLDPNGKMRRDISKRVALLYTVYLFTAGLLLAVEFVSVMSGADINFTQLALTTSKVTELFFPITTLFGAIVSASFGVSYSNSKHKI